MNEQEGQNEMTLIKDEGVTSLLEDRYIIDEDLRQVIHNAEKSGEKLFQPEGDRYLAKLTISDATFYVEYSISDDSYRIHTAYFHRSEFVNGE